VANSIIHLNTAARAMRRRRFADGALRLDQSKLSFELDDDGNPAVVGAVQAENPADTHMIA
jgi:hypothetical protein